ncbi:MAG: NAD-binding protein, partial [Nitrospinota bacterium]
HILPRTFGSGFSLGLQHKDLQMCVQLAREQGVMALFANLTAQVLQHGVRLEGPDADHTRLACLFEEWMGVKLEG